MRQNIVFSNHKLFPYFIIIVTLCFLSAFTAPVRAVWDNGIGDLTYYFDGPVYIWDISGSYDGSVDELNMDLYYTMTQDASGKITGYGYAEAYIYGADIYINFDVTGSVSQTKGITKVKLNLKGKGTLTVGYESVPFTFKEYGTVIIDSYYKELSGDVKVRVSAMGRSASQTVYFSEPLPYDMDGTSTLTLTCAASGKALVGTGTLMLSNGETQSCSIKDKYNAKKDESTLTIKGVTKNSLTLKVNGSDGTITSLKGKVMGQSLKATGIAPE
jgi:hypothetical protein